MKNPLLLCLLISITLISGMPNEKVREFLYNGNKVKTTYAAEERFYGTYKGRKSGFLTLNPDGTGEYKYDIFAFPMPGCTPAPIKIEWGFMLDEDGNTIQLKRDYGFSYPILYKSVGKNSFKGCRDEMLLDFIIEQKLADAVIHEASIVYLFS